MMEKAKPSQFANWRIAKFYRSLYTTGDMEKWNTKGEKENRKTKYGVQDTPKVESHWAGKLTE